ncbi:ATP-binding cassette domain-containing protein [Rhizobium leguminosarum]|nr:ATP-binding cassette domain-containing protein [Rhizobium leguminosarum]
MALWHRETDVKRYPNGMLALDRLNLTIGRGEFVSLLGPSGCGKSTILYILAGLVKATAGRVDIADMRAGQGAEAPIGFVFQEASLLPWATVAENIALPLTLGRRTGADRAKEVRRCLDMVGLEAFAGAYPRELSGGMKMRVSIARALITRPQLLLLDERQTGCTIVMVTHNTTESVYLSSRIVVMAAGPGRIVGSVDIDEFYPRSKKFRLSPAFSGYAVRVSELLDGSKATTGSS